MSDRTQRLDRGATLAKVAAYVRFLQGSGVRRQDRVVVLMPKSVDAVCAILACMRLGAVAVPLDVRTPDLRRDMILEHIEPALILTDDSAVDLPEQNPATEELSLLDVPEQSDVAVILMSSGTTGRPKAIQITHGNLAAFVDWAIDAFEPCPGDVVLSVAPLHFDLCYFDILVSQIVGAQVHLLNEEEAAFPAAIVTAARTHGATMLYTVPTVYQMIARLRGADMPTLRWVLFAGEAMPVETLRDLKSLVSPSAQFANLYGPTETNVVTCHQVSPEDLVEGLERLPIGYACSGARVWIGDDTGDPVPHNEIGEIYVDGPTVSPGYWRDEDRNRSLFSDRFPNCVRTGDLGWRTEDGVFYLAGRKDRHVKLRGNLVNLSELEAVIAQCPDVSTVAAILYPRAGLSAALRAHVVLSDGSKATALDLTRFVMLRLPRYYSPGHIEFRDSLPRTLNGKTDYKEIERFEQDKE